VADIPDRLIHRDVETSGKATEFSSNRGHGVAVVDLPTKTLSVTIGSLDVDQGTRRHRHTYETVLYILSGEGFTEIEGQEISWKKGDAVYVPIWAWHRHVNTGRDEAKYLATENAPLLQNLGGLALREEEE